MIITFRDPVQLVANLEAALLAAGIDTERPTAQVRLEVRKGLPGVARFVATDGHWMWINEIATGDAEEDALLHFTVESAKSIVRMVDTSKKAQSWAVEIDTHEKTVQQLSTKMIYEESKIVFPPYQQVIPDVDGLKKAHFPTIDAQLLNRISQAFVLAAGVASGKAAREKRDANSVALSIYTRPDVKHSWGMSPEPVIITGSTLRATAHAMAVVMPMRDAPTGSPQQLIAKYAAKGEKAA